jgi:hypothetical protein
MSIPKIAELARDFAFAHTYVPFWKIKSKPVNNKNKCIYFFIIEVHQSGDLWRQTRNIYLSPDGCI